MALINDNNLQTALTEFKNRADNKYEGYLHKIDDINLRSTIGEKLDYGYFILSNKQVISGIPTSKVLINIDKPVEVRGIEFNASLHSIRLKKGKTYRIEIGVASTSVTWDGYSLYNVTTDTLIDSINIIPATSTDVRYSHLPVKNCIYTATGNDDIALLLDGYNSSGRTVNNAYIIIEEIGRTFIVDPMDVKETHKLKYGRFKSSGLTFTEGSKVLIDGSFNGNIPVNKDGTVTLTGGKTYEINFSGRITDDSGAADIRLYNNTDGLGIGAVYMNISSQNYNSNWSPNSTASGIIEVAKDTDFCLFCEFTSNHKTVKGLIVSINIKEVTQPVFVEYNKQYEIKNPLTTSDISQESPVGSIINYTGLTAPEHYLLCDGSVYNISDYPQLAEHIKTQFGSYNYFGGDGITTFKLSLEGLNYDIVSPIMTGDKTPTPYITSANATESSNFPAWKAFNGNSNTIQDSWSSGTTSGWLKIDCSKKISFNAFLLQGRYSSNLTTFPRDFILWGSNDDITYDKIKAYTNQTISAPSETKLYILDGITSYRYLKLEISAASGGTSVCIGELSFIQIRDIRCIKYEPTHYAVNQYGGFESTVLFDGNANAVGSYTLTDSLENYDFIIVNGYIVDNSFRTQQMSNTIFPSEIRYGEDTFLFSVTIITANRRIIYSFTSATTLYLSKVELNTLAINKIIGIKGQLPSLMQGGTF
ncbi:discoidin domain-containing protein [Lachnoclostridium sp.]|uniref:discoidin domain-containing protein n=1 Tax=Lachnoclostridium sp. TaxID=2028282 RepID=UPI0028976566|nr:discoidin domain-containing protein [Lachnoclostridium sp.]